jgi:predicted membrane-bound spermidine synthase
MLPLNIAVCSAKLLYVSFGSHQMLLLAKMCRMCVLISRGGYLGATTPLLVRLIEVRVLQIGCVGSPSQGADYLRFLQVIWKILIAYSRPLMFRFRPSFCAKFSGHKV